ADPASHYRAARLDTARPSQFEELPESDIVFRLRLRIPGRERLLLQQCAAQVLEGVLFRGGFVRFRRERARRTHAADERQFQRRIERIDPEAQAEEIHFEAFDRARGEAGETEKRDLEAAPARRRSDQLYPGIVLADRGRRQIGFELGHRAQYPG